MRPPRYTLIVITVLSMCIPAMAWPSADAIAQDATPDAIDQLVDQLRDPDNEVRRAAAEALGALGAEAEAVAPALFDLLADRDVEVRSAAAEALGAISDAADALRTRITVEDGRLGVEVVDRPLEQVLEAISDEAEVAIIVDEAVEGPLVSDAFSDLPLDQGIRRLLQEQDAFFYYAADGGLRAVWVYPADEGQGLQPVPPDVWASTEELELDLRDRDPKRRAQAVETLVERRGDRALDSVLEALGDRNDRVRAQALYGALNADVALPVSVLSDLALDDPSESVRFLALEALAEDPMIEVIAVQALDDPSQNLRNKAEEILERLDRAGEAPAPEPSVQGRQAQ